MIWRGHSGLPETPGYPGSLRDFGVGAQKVGTEGPQNSCRGVRGPTRCSVRFCSRNPLGSTEFLPHGPPAVSPCVQLDRRLCEVLQEPRATVFDDRTFSSVTHSYPTALEVPTRRCLCPLRSGVPRLATLHAFLSLVWAQQSRQAPVGRALPSLLAPVVLCTCLTPGRVLPGVQRLLAGRAEGLGWGGALDLGRERGLAWPLPPARTSAGKWGRW